jgi:hypothetical protein
MIAEIGPCECIGCAEPPIEDPCGNAAAFFYHHIHGYTPFAGGGCATTTTLLCDGSTALQLYTLDGGERYIAFKLYYEYRIDKHVQGFFSTHVDNIYPGREISFTKRWIYRINRYTGEETLTGPQYIFSPGTPNDIAMVDAFVGGPEISDGPNITNCFTREITCSSTDDRWYTWYGNGTYCNGPTIGGPYHELESWNSQFAYDLFDDDTWSEVRTRIDNLYASVTTTEMQDHVEDYGEDTCVARYLSDGSIYKEWSSGSIAVTLPVLGGITHVGCTTFQAYQSIGQNAMYLGMKVLIQQASDPAAFSLEIGTEYTLETFSVPCLIGQPNTLDSSSSYTPSAPGWYALEAPWQKLMTFV